MSNFNLFDNMKHFTRSQNAKTCRIQIPIEDDKKEELLEIMKMINIPKYVDMFDFCLQSTLEFIASNPATDEMLKEKTSTFIKKWYSI